MHKTDRTSSGLKSVLFEVLDDLRNGRTTAQKAGAAASIVGQIVNVSKLEIAYQRFVDAGDDAQSGKAAIPNLKL